MSRINVSNLKSGMVLTAPVITSSGNILLKEGVEITEKHIGIFKKWGIWEVNIQGNDSLEANAESLKNFSEQELSDLDNKIRERFPFSEENPVMHEIMRITKQILLANRSKQFLNDAE